MARALAVFRQCDHALVDELSIFSMYVETEQHEPTSSDTTYTVQQPQSLCYKVVRCLALCLVTKIVLRESGIYMYIGRKSVEDERGRKE